MLIYHYTDENGLLGIIRKKALWATDIRFLNDSMEYYAGIESLAKLCDEIIAKCDSNNNEVYKSAVPLYESLPDFIEKNLKNRSLYITSLTPSRDNLRQWMSYCPKNSGYAIAFNKEKLLISGGKERSNNVVCRLEEVDYQKEQIRHILDIDLIINKLVPFPFSFE